MRQTLDSQLPHYVRYDKGIYLKVIVIPVHQLKVVGLEVVSSNLAKANDVLGP